MGELKGIMEDLAFPFVYPEEYEWLTKQLDVQFTEREQFIEEFEKSSFQAFQNLWNHWDTYQDKVCQIRQEDTLLLEGIEKGVDKNGVLLIETSAGLKKVISGDVSLRVIS